MKKNILFGLCASLLLLASCDYNKDNFPGFDDNPITDVIYYEGEFTGKYPTEGYFNLIKGDEDAGKTVIESALVTMLKTTYPYCDKGSSAKITVKIADLLPSQEKEPAYTVNYTLAEADYKSMGTGKNQPGQYNNFSKYIDPNDFLPTFCSTKYADKAAGTIVKITYLFYVSKTETYNQSKYYKKDASGWIEESLIPYIPSKKYTLVNADYAAMGTDAGEPGAINGFTTATQADDNLIVFLKSKYAYVATNGMTLELTYKLVNKDTNKIYRYDGNAWSIYNPKEPVIVSIANRITVMKFDGKTWKLSNLISNVTKQTMVKADYTLLFDWVKANKAAGFLSTQGKDEEYYTGSSSAYGNINNAYATWSKYYNVNGYLNNLDNDQIQDVMDKQLAEGIATILLPAWIVNPDPDTSYTAIYKIYGGRGNGDYAMSFYYNAEDKMYTWDEMIPIKQ